MESRPPAMEAEGRARKSLVGLALLVVVAVPLLYPAVVVPLSPWQQAEVSLGFIGVALIASLYDGLRPLIMFLSCFASIRYFYWRISFTLNLERRTDEAVSLLLLAAETYGLVCMFLGYFQTVEIRPRSSPPLGSTPSVDVFIPTYNESVEILRRTIIGAKAIDYPRKKVFLLDDGKRPEVEKLASRLGCGYMTRPDNRHAKAGNLNHALSRTEGELVAIFDADHVPVRGFLKRIVGFFDNERVAFVQSAQHFFNPDPFERNLRLTGRIAPEQSFFYHVVQPGNDFWDSAFFCGSCAVLRRTALDSIGGVKTDTVTEDAHTALELHARGYSSVYLALPLAAGLATESFAAHVMQRMRWARGMAQILRLDCPLWKRGLTVSQRLNYFNAMLHFFFGIPRLVLILTPLTYLLLGIHPVQSDVLSLLAYILPHLGLSTLANSMLSDRYRHSFWAGVYEVSIAPYTTVVTLLAMLSPRKGKFNVTVKGESLDRARWDYAHSWGTLLLLGLTILGLVVALPVRVAMFSRGLTDPNELESTLINSAWAFANFWTLLAAAYVAYEQPQQRTAPRVRRDFGCRLRQGERTWTGRVLDISETGLRLEFEEPVLLPEGGDVLISSHSGFAVRARAERVWSRWGGAEAMEAAYRFVDMDEATGDALIQLMFSDDASWLAPSHPRDDPYLSFQYLLATFWRVNEPRLARGRGAPRLRGRWRCRLAGVEGRCTSMGTDGAEVQLDHAPPEEPGLLPFSVEASRGAAVSLSGRIVERRSPTHVALAFEWADASGPEAFAQALYRDGHWPALPALPQLRTWLGL